MIHDAHLYFISNYSYERLGNTTAVWQDPLKLGWTKPGFGAWNNKTFTSEQMKGLYGVLGNSSLLFGETVTNSTVKDECKSYPAQTKCGFLHQMKVAATLNQTSDTYRTLLLMIGKTLCLDNVTQCFNPNLTQMIFPYIQHVNKYTMGVLLGEQFEIVTTMSQKNLTLGYTMEKVIHPKTRQPISVPGVVMGHKKMSDAHDNVKDSTFHTGIIKCKYIQLIQ